MKGVLRNEFIKLWARREIVVSLAAALLLPFLICVALTAGENEDPAKYKDVPANYYQSMIDAAERLLEQEHPDDPDGADRYKLEAELYRLLQAKNVFSTRTWQYAIAEISLQAGFADETIEAIAADDYGWYYDKMAALTSSESQRLLFEKLKSLDVYPDYKDYRYLLALRVSEGGDTPEDKLLLYRIENGIPENQPRGSYAVFVERAGGMVAIVFLIICAFVSSCVFATDRKSEVPHPSVMISGRVKPVAGKVLLAVTVLPLTALIACAVALSAGRALLSGAVPGEANFN
ncbi:MAG: hypothetical protein ILO53_06925 [Clostridia bacterium]|nr:hypothetical protein [Clostridia bacterium]